MADYCAYTDVASEIQYVTLSASSDPSTTEVTTWCGQVTAEINARFNAVGITTPVTDTEKLKVIKAIAVDWVVWKVLSAIDMESEEAGRRKSSYDKSMARIEANPAIVEETTDVLKAPEGSVAKARPFTRAEKIW